MPTKLTATVMAVNPFISASCWTRAVGSEGVGSGIEGRSWGDVKFFWVPFLRGISSGSDDGRGEATIIFRGILDLVDVPYRRECQTHMLGETRP